MPAAASTRPWWVATIVVGPRRATTRTVSAAIAVSRSPGAHPALGLADHLAGHGDDVAVARGRSAAATSAARSSPVVTSPTPSGARTSRRHRGPVIGRGRARLRPSRRSRRGRSSSGVRRGTRCRAPRPRATWRASIVVDQPAVEDAAGAAGAVVLGHPGGADLDTDRRSSSCSAMPRTWLPPTIGERPTTGALVARSASRSPGTPRIVPTETTGFDGGSSTTSASAIASRTPGPGCGLVEPDERPASRRAPGRAAGPSTPGSARPAPRRRLRVVDHDVGLDPVVGHRQQPHAVAPERVEPAPAERLGHRAQRVAGLEHLGAHQVGRDVAVAEPEPGRLHAVRRQLLLGVPGLVAAPPAALGVDAVA